MKTELSKKPKTEKLKEPEQKTKGDADSSSDEDSDEDDAEIVAPSKAEKMAANAKLKKDIEKEQKEMAKVLLTNRQRKLYQKAED